MKLKKEIEELYFIDVTSNYVVVNDHYQGILILDFDLNIIKSLKLNDDIIISYSITNHNKMLLFCYENECIFFVDLDLLEIKRIEMNMFPDVYFSGLFKWNNDYVYLLGNNGETCIKINLANEMAEEVMSNFGNKFKDCFKKLWELNIRAYDSINSTVLIDQDSEYILYDYKNGKMKRLNINSVEESKDNISSDLIYCKTDFSSDAVIRICERNIQILSKDNIVNYLYPPYETYRYSAGKILKINSNNVVFALCCDNSCDGTSLVIKYILSAERR